VIGLVDYGLGNLRSVKKALEFVGCRVVVVDHPQQLEGCKGVVFPGQGAFSDCMKCLKQTGMDDALRQWIKRGLPYLGICLGLQALFEGSDEGAGWPGIGVIAGHVKKFGAGAPTIPHMGWNRVQFVVDSCNLFRGVENGAYFYFDHSYYGVPIDPSVGTAFTEHGEVFPSVIWKGNCFGVQFHPEKSQAVGLQLLKNFHEICL